VTRVDGVQNSDNCSTVALPYRLRVQLKILQSMLVVFDDDVLPMAHVMEKIIFIVLAKKINI